MLIFKHFWSKLLLMPVLCLLYGIVLNTWGQRATCLVRYPTWPCLYYQKSAENRQTLAEALHSVRTDHYSVSTIEKTVETILSEDNSNPSWKELNHNRLLKLYLRLFIMENGLVEQDPETIEERLLGLNWPYTLSIALIFLVGFIAYCQWRIAQLPSNLELKQKAATFTLNTAGIMFVALICISLWFGCTNQLTKIDFGIYLSMIVGALTAFWKKLETYYTALNTI